MPLYHQLKRILEMQMQKGEIKPHQVLPTEMEFCEYYSVSRTTVRQALRELLSEGILYRKNPRGRLLLAPVKDSRNLTRLEGFFRFGAMNSGVEPETSILSVGEVSGTQIFRELGATENERVYGIRRLFYGGGEPLALQTAYISEKILPNLRQLDLTKSIFSYIEAAQGQPIVKAKQKIETRQPTREERALLNLSPKETVFQVNRTSFTENDRAVEYFECVLRGDRYQFVMDLHLEK